MITDASRQTTDTTLTDEERRDATARHMPEQSAMDEGLIEQLVRGTSWATQTELIENERSDV